MVIEKEKRKETRIEVKSLKEKKIDRDETRMNHPGRLIDMMFQIG